MNNHGLQSYFEKMCDIYYTARQNAKRLGDGEGEDADEETRYIIQYWNTRAWNEFVEITAHITLMLKNRYKIIVTTKEEAFTLMDYCIKAYPSAYKLINLQNVHLIDYPKDEMSKAFLEAYIREDKEQMAELHKKYF